jgi:hypothetical protein
MKNLVSFDEFITESVLNDKLETLINEGVLATKGASHLSDYTLQDVISDADDDDAEAYKAIADCLGVDAGLVYMVDSETNEEDPIQKKIYKYLASRGNFSKDVDPKGQGMGQYTMHDPKMNVVRLDDYGFVGFYFTADSKF